VFHFNKKHLEDPTIPMWVIKTRGESFYVNHVDCQTTWSTKETPDNAHTKGSIKIKRCNLVIDSENCATITPLDPNTIIENEKFSIRIITRWGKKLKELSENKKHAGIKEFGGACSTSWYVAEIFNEKTLTYLSISIPDIRKLAPNEPYYTMYDEIGDRSFVDIDGYEDLYED